MANGTYDPGYTQPERAASQRELDILRQRVEQMDAQGTRGVGVIQSQVAELVKDHAEMRGEVTAWQHSHDSQHDQEKRDRISDRRWIIGTMVTIALITVTLLGVILQHLK